MPVNFKLLFLLISMVFFMSACFHEDDDSAANALVGSWGNVCDIDANESEKFKLTFANSGFSFSSVIYSDTNCTLSAMEMAGSGTYKIGNEIIIASGDTVKEIDINITQLIATVKDSDWADDLNFGQTCGKTDWTVDVAYDASLCSDFDLDTTYDIYKIENGRVFFGDENSDGGDTVDNRRSILESEGMPKL